MKFFYLVFIFLLVIISACNSIKKDEYNYDYNEAEYKTLFDPARYMIPTPDGVYEPAGLTKMNLLSTYNFGKKGGNFKEVIFRDQRGVITPMDSLYKSDRQVFTQLYQDQNGKVVEAVVFDISDDLKKKIRDGYIPSNESSSNTKLRDRFFIPTAPGHYTPKGFRKLNVIEMNELGDAGKLNAPFIKKNEKGEIVGEDYYVSGPNMRYMQTFVDKDGNIKEGVVYDMTDEISAIFLMFRFFR